MVADKCSSCTGKETAYCDLNHARVTGCGDFMCIPLTEKVHGNMELMNAHPQLGPPDDAHPLCLQTDEIWNKPCRYVTNVYYPFQPGHNTYV